MKRLTAALVGLAAALALTGCWGNNDTSREDAHDTNNVDRSAPEGVAFNNHFPNVETKCNHGHRIYVATAGQVKFRLVPNDPTCGR